MGGQNSKIKIKNKDIKCSVVNNFVYHDNEITFESPNKINKFNIVHTYGINGEKWIDNEFLNIDFLYDDKNYLVKYRQNCLSVNIYFKKHIYEKLKKFLFSYPNHYLNQNILL